MLNKVLLFGFLLALLILPIGFISAFGQAGVNVGSTFQYKISGFGIDPVVAGVVQKTEYLKVEITNVDGIKVATQNTLHRTNGDDTIVKMEYYLDSGVVNITQGALGDALPFMYAVSPANLNVNDRVYPSSSKTTVVKQTISKSYLNSVRTTNFFEENNTNTSGYYFFYHSVYFDKSTGILVEFNESLANSQGTGGYAVSLTQSSLWQVPEFSSSMVLVLVMAITALSAVACKYRGKTLFGNLKETRPAP